MSLETNKTRLPVEYPARTSISIYAQRLLILLILIAVNSIFVFFTFVVGMLFGVNAGIAHIAFNLLPLIFITISLSVYICFTNRETGLVTTVRTAIIAFIFSTKTAFIWMGSQFTLLCAYMLYSQNRDNIIGSTILLVLGIVLMSILSGSSLRKFVNKMRGDSSKTRRAGGSSSEDEGNETTTSNTEDRILR